MAHLFQIGAGSGGMPVLDMVCRDARVRKVTLVEPDVYKPHNVGRHLFPLSAVGQPKAALAQKWLQERRPDLEVRVLECDITDPFYQNSLHEIVAEASLSQDGPDAFGLQQVERLTSRRGRHRRRRHDRRRRRSRHAGDPRADAPR